MSFLAVQADMAKDDVPQATSIVTYSQFLGGMIALSLRMRLQSSNQISSDRRVGLEVSPST